MGSLLSVGQTVISYIVGEDDVRTIAYNTDHSIDSSSDFYNPNHLYANNPYPYRAYRPSTSIPQSPGALPVPYANPPNRPVVAQYQRPSDGNEQRIPSALLAPPPAYVPAAPLPPPPLPPPPLPPPPLPISLQPSVLVEDPPGSNHSADQETSNISAEASHAAASFPSIAMSDLRLERVLGGGGFGQVWQGSWCGTPVAVKVLNHFHSPSVDQERENNAFEAEVSMLASMRHPNICLLLGISTTSQGGNTAIVTELVPRGSLWDVLHNSGNSNTGNSSPLTEDQQFRVLSDTCRGLAYLHRRVPAILHRDLKSANLLIDDAFHVKICDFGLARLRDMSAAVMTAQVGTVQWMAPEIIRGDVYSESADIYSLGIVMWEVFTGLCPYEGMTVMEIVQKIGLTRGVEIFRPPIPSNCSPSKIKLMTDCWSQIPVKRPTASDILTRLETIF